MKKIIALAIVATSFVACENKETGKVEVDSSTTTATTPSTSSAYNATDGDVTYTDKRVRVMRNGQWVDADEDVKLDNGVVVYRDGRVRRDDLEIEMEDGEVVNRTGNFFDRSGRAIDNAWDVTKEGAKDAGRAVKNTANKVGQKVEDVLDNDDKDDKKKNN